MGKFIGAALSQGGGSSSGGSSGLGGFSSLFSGGSSGGTRPISENRNYRGGLFSENTASNSNPNSYPITRYGDASPPAPNPTASHGNYGWKVT